MTVTADESTSNRNPVVEGSERNANAGESASAETAAQRSTPVRWARRGYVLFAGIFALCVVVQVFIAGMAVFVNPARWSMHVSFVNVFAFLPIVMLALAFVGRLPRDLWVLPVVLWVLIAVQYVLAGHYGFGYLVAALHPVNALVIFWLAVVTTQRAWSWVLGTAGDPS